MKKKKIRKISNKIFSLMNKEKSKYEKKLQSNVIESNGIHYCEYDEQTLSKIKSFIINLLKLENHLRVDIHDNGISMNCDLYPFIKKQNNTNQYSGSKSLVTNDDNISVEINKHGVCIRKSYSKYVSYKDQNLLEEMRPIFTDRLKDLSKDTLTNIIDDVMIITNLSRDTNLDEILGQ